MPMKHQLIQVGLEILNETIVNATEWTRVHIINLQNMILQTKFASLKHVHIHHFKVVHTKVGFPSMHLVHSRRLETGRIVGLVDVQHSVLVETVGIKRAMHLCDSRHLVQEDPGVRTNEALLQLDAFLVAELKFESIS